MGLMRMKSFAMCENSASLEDAADMLVDRLALVAQRTIDQGNVDTRDLHDASVWRRSYWSRWVLTWAEEACR